MFVRPASPGHMLGHSQAVTSARYAHLDNDPLRRASEAIANKIAAALERNSKGSRHLDRSQRGGLVALRLPCWLATNRTPRP
jgi:hypothetical protein